MAEKGVIIRPSFYEAIKMLEEEEQLALFHAICEYGLYDKEPEELLPVVQGYFMLIQPVLDSACKRYNASVKNGTAAKKQTRKKKTDSVTQKEDNPGEANTKQTEARSNQTSKNVQPSNDLNIDIDRDIDIEKESDKEIEKDSVCVSAHPAQTVAGKPRTNKKFTIPSVRDVEGYCRENGYAVDAERFVDYYSAVGWKVGKNPMRDWQAAVRTWVRKDSPAPAAPQDDHCGYVLAPLEDPWEVAMRGKYHV